MTKVSKEIAEKVVRAWLSNSFYGEIARNDHNDMPSFGYGKLVRVFLAQFNKLASNAMWDGKPNLAYKLIKQFGFGDTSFAAKEDAKEMRSNKSLNMQEKQSYIIHRTQRDYDSAHRLRGNARRKRIL